MLKEGDRVYLFRRNIKIKQLYDKLDFKKEGLFLIEKKVYRDIYKLKLPLKLKIYLIFYIGLLEFILTNISLIISDIK